MTGKGMTPIYYHDLYCPDVGFGCNHSNMDKVRTCGFYAGVQRLVKTARDEVGTKVSDLRRLLQIAADRYCYTSCKVADLTPGKPQIHEPECDEMKDALR